MRALTLLVICCTAFAASARAQQPAAGSPPDNGLRLRVLGGFANKSSFASSLNGLQVGGEVFKDSFADDLHEIAVGLFYGRMHRSGGGTERFVEGTGLFLFRFEPGKRVRPFAGGGLTVGHYSIVGGFRYVNIAVAGGVNVDLGNRRAFRIDARLSENFSLLAGYSF